MDIGDHAALGRAFAAVRIALTATGRRALFREKGLKHLLHRCRILQLLDLEDALDNQGPEHLRVLRLGGQLVGNR
jgi:hypothetical protein